MAKSKTLSAFKDAQENVVTLAGNTGQTRTDIFDPKDWEKVCLAIEAAYPDLTPDPAAVKAAGKGRNGMAQKLAVYKAPTDKGRSLKARNVTLYSSGKSVWTNLDPIVA